MCMMIEGLSLVKDGFDIWLCFLDVVINEFVDCGFEFVIVCDIC